MPIQHITCVWLAFLMQESKEQARLTDREEILENHNKNQIREVSKLYTHYPYTCNVLSVHNTICTVIRTYSNNYSDCKTKGSIFHWTSPFLFLLSQTCWTYINIKTPLHVTINGDQRKWPVCWENCSSYSERICNIHRRTTNTEGTDCGDPRRVYSLSSGQELA